MLGDISPQSVKITSQAVVYPGRDHVTALNVKRFSGRQYSAVDLSLLTRVVLVFPQLDPVVAYDTATAPAGTITWAGSDLTIDLSDFSMPASVQRCYIIVYDAEHTSGQVLVDDNDAVVEFDFRNVSAAGIIQPPVLELITDAPIDGETYGRKDGAWVALDAVVAGVSSVDGRTGAVTLSDLYAPLAHVGAGGAAHADVIAGGAAGFMTGADKTKLEGVAAGATANADTDTLAEGSTNLYHTETRVRSTLLTGLSLAVSTAVAATDSILVAIGKLAARLALKEQTLTAGTNVTIDRTDPENPVISASGGGGSGDVVGPASAVNNGVALFDGITGKLIKDGGALGTAAFSSTGDFAAAAHVGSGGAAHADAVAAGAAGFMTGADKTKLDGIEAGAQANVGTNLTATHGAATVAIASSTGDDATLLAATATEAGAMTAADKVKLDGVETGAQANVGTDIAQGTRTATTVPITSSTGDDATLAVATTSLAGVMSADDKTKLDGVATGATANSSDATLLDRANHTGVQAISTVTGLQTALDGKTGLPVVATFTGNKTLALADINTYNVSQDATAQTVTLPAQATVAWTADAEIHIEQGGAGTVTVTGATGVTVNGVSAGSFALAGQFSVVTLKRVASNSWTLLGGLAGDVSVNGNLVIVGAGRRIRGDFSNATLTSRVMFQSSVVNGSSFLYTIPNGTSTSSGNVYSANSDISNASLFGLFMGASAALLDSYKTGTGAYVPFRFGAGGSTRWELSTAGNLTPFADNLYAFGSGSLRPAEIFAATGTINTSDGREKNVGSDWLVRPLSSAEKLAAKAMAAEIGAYKFLAAIAEKGEAARSHIGMTVQRAIEIMESYGLDPFSYGFICRDEWPDTAEEVHPESGEVIRSAIPAGDRLSFRDNELSHFLMVGIHARILDIESRMEQP